MESLNTKNYRKGFLFNLGVAFLVISTWWWRISILGRLGLHGFVLEGHLILRSLRQFSNGFVESDQKFLYMEWLQVVILIQKFQFNVIIYGNSIFVIVSVFAGSTFTPSNDIICPRNKMDFTPIWHFFLFSFSPLLRNLKNTLFKRSSFDKSSTPYYYIILGVSIIGDIWNNFLLENVAGWMNSVG